jgi:hypothetical protein
MTSAARIGTGLLVLLAACHPAKPPPTPAKQDRGEAMTPDAAEEDSALALKPYPVEDWSTKDLSYAGGASRYAASRAICASVIHAEPPAADLPNAKGQAALKGCDSEALYFGLGLPADPVKARQCAMIERTLKRQAPFGFYEAEGTLAMIYANGRGVARNYDVAIHMACRIEDAPAATDARIGVLAEYRRTGWKGDSFDTCGDNRSGVGEGVCADNAARIAEQERGARIAELKRGWTPERGRLFDRLYASLRAYAETAHEMDCHGGTAHAACTIRGQDIDTERFLGRIEALVRGRPLPRDTPSEGPHPAIGGEAWEHYYGGADESEREWLKGNREQAIAARRVFERDLVAFARAALPRFTPHQVRATFANI